MLIFRQLFDSQSSTYTYLLADARTRDAVLIDPVYEHVSRDCALLQELDLKLGWTLALTGHALLIRGCWRADFQQGDPRTLCDSVHRHIFSLPHDCLFIRGTITAA